ncbi:hypothetical protein CDAR_613641 [Caerostris darwini]|uniref:Uncharacterized protein n=1 Tax=Caerostris darwini TaxID=1538125 RepID=A0AAV4RT11_9ARAC|nr:hypothetical protein CDAR_613641 [Caerostris darwini]
MVITHFLQQYARLSRYDLHLELNWQNQSHGHNDYPPRTIDYFLWEYMKSLVYETLSIKCWLRHKNRCCTCLSHIPNFNKSANDIWQMSEILIEFL